MNRHVGASFTLSVLVVGFFAVVLYQPDPPGSARPGRPGPKKSAHSAPSQASNAPPLTPGVPLVEASSGPFAENLDAPRAARSGPSEPGPHGPSPIASTGPRGVFPARVRPVSAAEGRPSELRPGPLKSTGTVETLSRRRPESSARRPAFTRVAAGESLTNVAVRVYGAEEAARTLWLANRDVIEDPSATLRTGTLLRTP